VLRQLARRSIVPREVTGIDASRGMLARVGPLPRGWLLRVGDVRALDQPDESFDVLIASYLLQLLAPVDLTAARRSDRYRGLRALNPACALERAGFRLLRSRWSLRGYPSVCVLAIRPEHGSERE